MPGDGVQLEIKVQKKSELFWHGQLVAHSYVS